MNTVQQAVASELEFPDSDGLPMSENTRQYEAIVTLKGNIEAFVPRTAFVAGDHLIYVDSTNPAVRQAPDVYVAFNRPRGHRGSYKLWEENNVFPQVIFEVLGPSNTEEEMQRKRRWYFERGAEEYYEFDPEAGTWVGYILDRDLGLPQPVAEMDGHVSPLLGMRFGFRPLELLVYRPDGSRCLSFQEMTDQVDDERDRAEQERDRAEQERDRAEQERDRAEQERLRAQSAVAENERLRALLRAAGLDPDAPAL